MQQRERFESVAHIMSLANVAAGARVLCLGLSGLLALRGTASATARIHSFYSTSARVPLSRSSLTQLEVVVIDRRVDVSL